MTRYKRRKISGMIKCCAAVILPVAAAMSVSGASQLKRVLSETRIMNTGRSPEKSVSVEKDDFEEIFGTSSDDADEAYISAADFLSQGYGISAETADTSDLLKLPSPLEMTSADPGAKPYPTEWSEGGSIIRTTYGEYSGVSFFDLPGGGQVNNKTTIPNENLINESSYLPNFTVEDTDAPLVLIYHTHTTESFEPYVRESYDASFNYRTTDDTKNMVMVGNAMQAELEAQGIGVIHVSEIHDYPSYNGSYDRSRASIVPILEEYPSIKVVLDIHRDAISGEGFAYQPYINIDGKEAAQIMIISGCDDGTLNMPNYMMNFHFACYLQQKLESDHPGFTRPILFDYRHYNQDLTTGSLLIEVGSHGNTLEQAQYSGQILGKSLGELLNSMKKG